MAFPSSPIDGQIYNNYTYNSARNSWDRVLDKKSVKPNDENLIAHYSLDEENGVGGAVATYHLDGNALDMSGHGNHGTETDITYADGKSGQGAVFNGTSSTIDISTGWPAGNTTYSVWLNAKKTATNRIIINQEGGSARQLYLSSGENIQFNTRRSDGTTFIGSSIPSSEWTENTWYHVVGIQEDLKTSIYLNGVLIDSDTYADIYTSFTSVAHIGSTGTSMYTDCKIDEVNIFDRAISADEVLELYNNPSNKNLNPPTLPTSGLIGEWNLNGSSKDTSVNGNDGTLVADATYAQGRKNNKCLYLDGTGDFAYADIGAGILIKDFTSFAWYKGAGDGKGIVSYGGNTYGFIMGYSLASADFTCYLGTTGSTGSFSISKDIGDDKWHNVCLTYDGATAYCYVDGVEEGSSTAYSGNLRATTDTEIRIGAWDDANGDLLGSIEGVKVFNRVLTEQEILALAEQTNPIKDETGNNDGYSIGQLSSVKGVNGRGLSFFDSKYVTTPPNDFGTNDFSVALWVRPSTLIDDGNLLNNRIATDTWWRIYHSNGKIDIEVANSYPNQYYTLQSITSLNIGELVYVVFLRFNNIFKLFINGIEENTLSETVNISNGNPIVMGVFNYVFKPYTGDLDEVRIYDKALSQEEIRYLYEEKI